MMPRHEVRLVELPGVPLAVVRRRVSRNELGKAVREGCGRAWTFASRRNLAAGHNVALYLDGSILLEAGVELPSEFVEGEGIVRSATPAGLAAFTPHIGPYDGLHAAHAAIREWCRAHGVRPTGPNWEVYGHWQREWDTDPTLIRTDVYHQVERLILHGNSPTT
jgi:hypothetical protein